MHATNANAHTVNCTDCGNPISLNARTCPHCGSTEPFGAYRSSHTHGGRHFNIEARNDRNLALSASAFGILGASYGFATSTTALGALLAVCAYGLFGLIVGISIGFAINVMRGA